MDATAPPIVTPEVRIVDEQGHLRLLLSAKGGTPKIHLFRSDGRLGSEVSLDGDGRPSIKLANINANGPTAVLGIDGKGAHVKFDRSGGASGYLFLSDAGASGIVLIDSRGVRRLNAVIDPDGAASIERFGPDGKPLL
jgi:hypothetical protein